MGLLDYSLIDMFKYATISEDMMKIIEEKIKVGKIKAFHIISKDSKMKKGNIVDLSFFWDLFD